jgi:hypothetical protein
VKVLIIGAISLEKGALVINDFAERYGAAIELHLLGSACIPLHSKIVCHGPYLESELIQNIIDIRPTIAWYSSQCAETYCYTLTPSIALGLPIVAPKLGAFTERLENYVNSTLVEDYSNIDAVYNAILNAASKASGCATSDSKVKETLFYRSEYVKFISDSSSSSTPLDVEKLKLLLSSEESLQKHKKIIYSLVLGLYRTRLGQTVSRLIPARYLRIIKRKLFG